jgi:hypothetical protein
MTTTIEQSILDNLAYLMATVTGTKKAYSRAPMSVPDDKLPAAIILTGAARPTGKSTPGITELVRSYRCRWYVAHIQQGVTGEAETNVLPYLTGGLAIFLAHPALGKGTANSQVPFVMDAVYKGDSGVTVLSDFAGQQYLGVEFNLDITYKVIFSYSNFE